MRLQRRPARLAVPLLLAVVAVACGASPAPSETSTPPAVSAPTASGLTGAGPSASGPAAVDPTSADPAAPPSGSADPEMAAAVEAVLTAAMDEYHLQAVIARVTVDGADVFTGALGESITGVPATTDMHFRNGAVAFTYIGELLAILAGRGELDLDAPITTWLPEVPNAAGITVRMLANMTSGYADYVYQDEVLTGTDADPFRQWTDDELIRVGTSQPRMFEPGTNWGYSHTNYVLLGRLLTAATGKPLDTLMRDEVFGPMGLRHTAGADTALLPSPTLHSQSAERRAFLQIPAGTPFLEDSTYWNPSWTTASGAVQSTDITDLATTAEKVGSGALVTPELYQEQVGKNLVGVGQRTDACPVCNTITADRGYGLGVLLLGDWIAQTKNFAGEGAAMAYLPKERIAVALVTTLTADAYDEDGAATDPSLPLLRSLADAVAPDSPLGPR